MLSPDDRRQADLAALRQAWDRLRASAQAGEARRYEHVANVRVGRNWDWRHEGARAVIRIALDQI